MLLEVLMQYFCIKSNYLIPLERSLGDIQIVIITNFVVVSSVGIKRVDCTCNIRFCGETRTNTNLLVKKMAALELLLRSVITKTYLYNFDPLKPHFYIVKLGFTGVYIIFVISAQKHRLWVLVRTVSTRRF